MTKPALADELGSRLPSEQERMAANRLRQVLASHASEAITVRIIDEETKKPREIALPPGLSKLLTELLLHIGNGEAVTLVPVSKMLSTQQAADTRLAASFSMVHAGSISVPPTPTISRRSCAVRSMACSVAGPISIPAEPTSSTRAGFATGRTTTTPRAI